MAHGCVRRTETKVPKSIETIKITYDCICTGPVTLETKSKPCQSVERPKDFLARSHQLHSGGLRNNTSIGREMCVCITQIACDLSGWSGWFNACILLSILELVFIGIPAMPTAPGRPMINIWSNHRDNKKFLDAVRIECGHQRGNGWRAHRNATVN